jgi:TonB-dependent starch-binding outer membrane protein SusC
MAKRSSEQQIIGNGLPDFRGSFINQINLGNFDFLFDMQFSYGNDVLYQTVITSEDRFGLVNGYKTQLYTSWTPENQNTMVPRIRSTQLSGQDLHIDTREVQNGSYLRGNLVSIGYNFNKNVMNSYGIDNLRINASIENAFIIVSNEFMGYDPEASGGGGDSKNFGQNIFFHQYPKPRTFTLGLNIIF